MKLPNSQTDADSGFTFTELLVVVATLIVLSGLLLASPDRGKEKSQVLTDLSNLRQILIATSMYQTDNRDFMPHPTWGTVDGYGGSSPDGWAYAVKNNGKFTNGPTYIPSCWVRSQYSLEYSNQVQFFKIGQLAPFLPGISVMYCPKDVAQWNDAPFRLWFLDRFVKITSYVMNGTVGGYCPADARFNGKTYRVGEFKPKDIIFWEQNETGGFYFNDAANSPTTPGEGVTQRHYGIGPYSGVVNSSGGGGVVGRLSGAADFMRMDQFANLSQTTSPRPNDLLNGPGYR